MTVDQETIEQLIDKHTLADVLGMIEDVCYEKAEHVESAWQDRSTARRWRQAAAWIAPLARRVGL